jgi:hypothetical protein
MVYLNKRLIMEFWSGVDNKGISAKCLYDNVTDYFEVIVTYKDIIKKEKFKSNYVPRFGMDILDMSISEQIANKLAEEIENEFGLS